MQQVGRLFQRLCHHPVSGALCDSGQAGALGGELPIFGIRLEMSGRALVAILSPQPKKIEALIGSLGSDVNLRYGYPVQCTAPDTLHLKLSLHPMKWYVRNRKANQLPPNWPRGFSKTVKSVTGMVLGVGIIRKKEIEPSCTWL